MGWLFGRSWKTRQDVVNSCLNLGDKHTMLDHSVRGNTLWVLAQCKEGDKKGDIFVALFLLRKDGGMWGYKDMDDSCGPYYFDCPLSFIKRTVESGRTLCQNTLDWHEQVRTFHATKRARAQKRASFHEGMKIKYQGVVYKLMKKYPGRRGWEVMSMDDNTFYRMMAKQMSASEIVTG